jgi:hypothetical protein
MSSQPLDQTGSQDQETLQTILDRIAEKIKADAASPKEAAQKFAQCLHTTPAQKIQQCLSFVPTPMARTSPFFPMSDREKKNRPHETLRWKTSWGSIEVAGPRLSIFDEDVLLAILALLKSTQKKEETTTEDGHQTYTVRTSGYALCKYLGTPPGKNTYLFIEGAIDRMTATKVRLDITENSNGKKNAVFSMAGTILSGWSWDRKTGELTVTLNPYFYETFKDGLLTYLDLTLRRRLQGDISKALLRFYESHQSNPAMHMLTIAQAINLRDMPPFRLKARLKNAFHELKQIGYLKTSRIEKNGTVSIRKKNLPAVAR